MRISSTWPISIVWYSHTKLHGIAGILAIGLLTVLLNGGSLAAAEPSETNNKTSLTTLPIDLTQKDFYIRPGFSPEWLHSYPPDMGLKERRIWQKIPKSTSGYRTIRIQNIEFHPPIKREFSLFSNPVEHFTLVTQFKLNREQIQNMQPTALLLGAIGSNYEIFLNGESIKKEIHLNDKGEMEVRRSRRNLVLPLEQRLFRPGANILAFHIIGNPSYANVGLYLGQPYLIDHITRIHDKTSERLSLILIALYLSVGLYHLLLFWRRPKERYNLYFGLFSVGLFIYLMMRTNVIFELIYNNLIISKVELVVLFLTVIPLILFTDHLLVGSAKLFGRIYAAVAFFLSVAIILFPIPIGHYILRFWQLTAPLPIAYILYRVLRTNYRHIHRDYLQFQQQRIQQQRIQQQRKHSAPANALRATGDVLFNTVAGNLLVGFLVLAVTVVFDILDSLVLFTGISLTKYGFFIFVLGIAISLANKFLTVHQQVQELNQNLEKKVDDRTRRLKETLRQVQSLKEQQDGDYFLTSLLTDPFISNQADNERIKVDFYVKEKKEFHFRKWDKEIGGDMCMAHTIWLRNKKYTFFVNADAMGKSIQGAGGILVMGSVIKSLIERTLVSSVENSLFPEKWLRNAFVELQKVFESFNGSMLISAVLGLVDEKTSLMYFINAEHPWTILYRDGQSRFIEDELTFHKIGTQGVEGQLWVQTIQLEKGDMVFMGSDGRDDILLGEDPTTGERIINEDETMVLKHINEAQGDLSGLVSRIQSQGELTDDLSLLRLQVLEQKSPNPQLSTHDQKSVSGAKEALAREEWQEGLAILNELHQRYASHTTLLSLLAKAYRAKQDYANLLWVAQEYIQLDPENSQFIYLASLAAKKSKELELAADLGERYRLRDPKNERNLRNLADIYRLLGNGRRAQQMAQECLNIDPNDRQAGKLLQIIQRRFVQDL